MAGTEACPTGFALKQRSRQFVGSVAVFEKVSYDGDRVLCEITPVKERDMNLSMMIRFGIMMFLQYAVWGAWFSVLSAALENMGFTGMQIGSIYSLLPLACIISPFVGGQIADRYLNTEKFLGISHLIGAALMLILSKQFFSTRR